MEPSSDGTGTGFPPPVRGARIGRRVFLGLAGLAGAGVVTGGAVPGLVGRALDGVAPASGTSLTDLIPGANRFRIYTVTGSLPRLAPAAYTLHLTGEVQRPMALSYAELLALPRTRLVRDFQCVTGWRVPDVHWEGVLLRDLLDHVGLRSTARAVQFLSFDGVYTDTLTLDQARRSDVLVAYRFEGGPLPVEHGGPVRLYVAPMYGYKSVKWLGAIRAVSHPSPGYWENAGYAVNAWIGSSNGRSDAPVS